jgi:hypothetical protein
VIWPFFFLWLYLFPDGRAVPRRLIWLLGPALIAFEVIFLVFILDSVVRPPAFLSQAAASLAPLGAALIGILFTAVLSAQIYRYLRVSGPVERVQTRWFLFGLVVAFVPLTIVEMVYPLPAELDQLFFLALPLGIGFSVLRYRLFDIDVIIRKTLVYTVLTALLALVYFGSVVLLQSLLRGLTGQASPVAIVVSTLVIAALFTPLRGRVQGAIDRRFYRRSYDAARTLAAFGAVARDEVDLGRLTSHLLATVEDTVQPAHISLWLRTGGGK